MTVWVAICLPLAPSTSIPALCKKGRNFWLLPSLHSGITLLQDKVKGGFVLLKDP